MSDIQISKPVLIALIGAIVIGGFVLMRGGSGEELPPPPPAAATAPTGGTGSTGETAKNSGATGATGTVDDKESLEEKRRRIAKERRQKLVEEAKASGMPTPVYSALKDDKIVLIFFWEPDGKDDERTNDAVLNVEDYRGNSIVVVREQIANKSKYDGIAQAAELTQTPSMVILYKDEATTAQGYMDAAAINAKITRLTGDSGPGD